MEVITLEMAYGWLNKFEKNQTYISLPNKQLLIHVDNALADRDSDKISWIIDRLLHISLVCENDMELAEIILECARAFYLIGNLQDSIRLFSEASAKYRSHAHQFAISQWMLGYVLWKIPGRFDDAIRAWQRSRQKIKELSDYYSSHSEGAAWYLSTYDEMEFSIQAAIWMGLSR